MISVFRSLCVVIGTVIVLTIKAPWATHDFVEIKQKRIYVIKYDFIFFLNEMADFEAPCSAYFRYTIKTIDS